MIEPGVEAEAERAEALETGAEIRPRIEMRRDAGAAVADHRVGIVAGRVAHAAKPAAAGADMREQHRLGPVAEGQIDIADDPGRDAGLAVIARCAHRGDAGDELGLAERAQLRRAVLAVHRMAFEKHGRDDVVAGVRVGQQLVEQIAVAAAQPQMMVRIDDRQLRLDDRLRRGGREPGFIRRINAAELPVLPGRRGGRNHRRASVERRRRSLVTFRA